MSITHALAAIRARIVEYLRTLHALYHLPGVAVPLTLIDQDIADTFEPFEFHFRYLRDPRPH